MTHPYHHWQFSLHSSRHNRTTVSVEFDTWLEAIARLLQTVRVMFVHDQSGNRDKLIQQLQNAEANSEWGDTVTFSIVPIGKQRRQLQTYTIMLMAVKPKVT